MFNPRYYLVPSIKKYTFPKELLRLVGIGVPNIIQNSDHWTLVFITPKNNGAIIFITNYQNLNRKIEINPYPFPRICEKIHQIEGFQYSIALELNMGYYTIGLPTKSNDLTTIIAAFGKFRYNRVPMGICASGDIFQAKFDKHLSDTNGFKTCIVNVLVLRKGRFY